MQFSYLLPAIILLSGAYFLIRLRLFPLLRPRRVIAAARSALGVRGARRSFSLALAGTLGVGNLVGVAHGLRFGGAGMIFWMLVSSVFSAVIKYAESTLAADACRGGACGMTSLVRGHFRRLGTVYAILTVLLSLTMGAALQSQSAAYAGSESLGLPLIPVAVSFSLLVFAVVKGGEGKIERVTAAVIPISTIVYVLICVAVLCIRFEHLGGVLSDILSGAFTPRAAVGGVGAYSVSLAMREGFARGLLSNEAGAGSSAAAEARSDIPACECGILGALEVVFDTSILCTLTGITVLASGVDISCGTGVEILLSSVGCVLGRFAPFAVFLLILAFSYSTVVCWYFYGTSALSVLRGSSRGFLPLFLLSCALGCFIPSEMLISVTDSVLLLMCIPTLAVLIKSSDRLVSLSEQYGLLKKSDIGKRSNTALRKRRKS